MIMWQVFVYCDEMLFDVNGKIKECFIVKEVMVYFYFVLICDEGIFQCYFVGEVIQLICKDDLVRKFWLFVILDVDDLWVC